MKAYLSSVTQTLSFDKEKLKDNNDEENFVIREAAEAIVELKNWTNMTNTKFTPHNLKQDYKLDDSNSSPMKNVIKVCMKMNFQQNSSVNHINQYIVINEWPHYEIIIYRLIHL